MTILVPIDEHSMSNVYQTRCYGSCERVHGIIKHEHHNEIYPLAFLLLGESQKSTERSVYHKLCVPYIHPLTLLILFCYFILENPIQCCRLGISFKTTLIIFNGYVIMHIFHFD